eukprot:13127543-Alexandrium_andersonii.AAC.1
MSAPKRTASPLSTRLGDGYIAGGSGRALTTQPEADCSTLQMLLTVRPFRLAVIAVPRAVRRRQERR